ncbi:FecR family protein [Noviherbaspirillum aridicola]|uniref:FecR protein domain-containing protein n=1 Tax=Noviherbaspirillum aridicola TaxID=2849687 RepID=A0ABQ4Q2L2_9BURK|nr:FecR family protein [Noviherbaspirillum aridicola]GIZ51428.1 hypothetical protein NCCP691_14420 [Noviherbaspirillum aridicola]
MTQARSCTAIKALSLLASAFAAFGAAGSAHAGKQAGTVVNLNGPLLAKKGDGTVKVLSLKSAVEEGDVLVTEKATYARIRFIDDSEITLRPNTQLKVESFSFEEARPEKDSAAFNLVKGGLRAVTGALGKRNNERFGMNTPTATIGIRGTTFVAEYVAPEPAAAAAWGRATVASAADYGHALPVADSRWHGAPLEMLPMRLAQAAPVPTQAGRAPGLYVQVLDGMINVRNSAGGVDFRAGQFGFAPSAGQLPLVLPANPGMQFSPPPAFSSSTGPQGGAGKDSDAEGVDCEVR